MTINQLKTTQILLTNLCLDVFRWADQVRATYGGGVCGLHEFTLNFGQGGHFLSTSLYRLSVQFMFHQVFRVVLDTTQSQLISSSVTTLR